MQLLNFMRIRILLLISDANMTRQAVVKLKIAVPRTSTFRTVLIFISPGELSDLSTELYLPYPLPSPFYFV